MPSLLHRSAFPAAGAVSIALALAAGCGGTSAGTGGAGASNSTGTGTTSSTGTSTAPVPPDAAWTVNLSVGPQCLLMSSTRSLGQITDAAIVARVTDGKGSPVASVTCTVAPVAGSPAFHVIGAAHQGADLLSITIPSISAGATKASPATGTVTYESDATIAAYTAPNCNFYFASPEEGVSAGKIWVAFDCAALTDPATQSMCPIAQSVVAFESCLEL